MSEPFKITMTIEGPARTISTNYGEREERDKLASFDVAISGVTAWRIYQKALADVVAPEFVIEFPDGMTAEQRETFASEWTKRHG